MVNKYQKILSDNINDYQIMENILLNMDKDEQNNNKTIKKLKEDILKKLKIFKELEKDIVCYQQITKNIKHDIEKTMKGLENFKYSGIGNTENFFIQKRIAKKQVVISNQTQRMNRIISKIKISITKINKEKEILKQEIDKLREQYLNENLNIKNNKIAMNENLENKDNGSHDTNDINVINLDKNDSNTKKENEDSSTEEISFGLTELSNDNYSDSDINSDDDYDDKTMGKPEVIQNG